MARPSAAESSSSARPDERPVELPNGRRGGRHRRRVLLVAVSCLLAVALIEFGLRVVAHATGRPRGMGFHPEFGWRPIPGVEKLGAEWGVDRPAVINSEGFREDEIPFRKPDGVRRIVALGDSFTFGQGVDSGERFTDLLEARFGGLQVVNLGVCGYGTDQELRVFEELGVRYEPDLVLLTVFLGNDLDDIRHERHHSWPKPWFRLDDGELTLVEPESDWVVDLRLSSYLAEMVVSTIEPADAADVVAEPWRDAHPEPLFHALIRRLRNRVEASGAELLVVFAHAPGQEPETWARKLMARVERSGVTVLDTWSVTGGATADGPLYLDDGHWTPLGHRRVTEALVEVLRSRGF